MQLNAKIILDKCGHVSYKRGEAYFQTNKVKLEQLNTQSYKAEVTTGRATFHVTVMHDEAGELHTTCTCPKLTSFHKACQHVAAVLFAILDGESTTSQHAISDELRSLFTQHQSTSSKQRRHFEDRYLLKVAFICRVIFLPDQRSMLGIEIEIEQEAVKDIRAFLNQLKTGSAYRLSEAFIFDPSQHCFAVEVDAILRLFIQIMDDEALYGGGADTSHQENPLLLIPPSFWERLVPRLVMAQCVMIAYHDQCFSGFQVVNEALPLQFEFVAPSADSYELKIGGFSHLVILSAYRTVFYEGKLFRLESQDSERLIELEALLSGLHNETIPIPKQHIGYYLEKVAPALRKLGDVTIAETITHQLMNTPLIAKLYLDRLNHKLLAGLEFHYDHYVFNPIETQALTIPIMIKRELDKEEAILQLMRASAFTLTDGGYYMQNDDLEYEFLTYMLPKLEKLVQVYATTAVRNRVSKAAFRPRIRVRLRRERINMLEFNFELDGIIGNDIKAILKVLEEKRKYYRLRSGTLVSLETKEFLDVQRFLQMPQLANQSMENGLVLPLEKSLQLLDNVTGSETFQLEADFQEFVKHLYEPGALTFEVPLTLKASLRPYQELGYQWLKTLAHYGFGGILADDMGLGKSLQSIAFILSELQSVREKRQPVIIICPSSLLYNWLNEIKKFAPEIKVTVTVGNRRERRALYDTLDERDVVITSYPIVRADIHWYAKQYFYAAFFDEAQAFKNPLTQTARAVKQIQAGHRFALTGTPVENASEELWSIFHVILPELFLSLKDYSKLSNQMIARRIRPFLLRRVKADVLEELPEKVETIDAVMLLPDQKKLYAAYLAKLRVQALKHLDQETLRKNRIKILAGLTRLRQICCHPALFVEGYQGSSAKFEHLLRLVDEAQKAGRRVLIFSQFTKMLDLIGRTLMTKGCAYFYLDGQTPSEERVTMCERYNAGERDIFLISLKAGGTGLNLTGADTVILYDTWWNPAVEEQAADRAHRMGQKKVVEVIKLIAKGTIEEKMHALQAQKRDLINAIVSANAEPSAVLTEDELRELLML
ncbi:helicase SNF [Pullulanibacillus camelliae]|uniref:Helicase SNF n=1 Tax=Pullulanibacillus camelliae TaxID=1707096 RepID=A0A8J2YF63_9BACL|nr:DEAD/DEAH box helicase [Pullulanibacillus camelliae]GGE40638.1 helicase SNF [Pullulanibacillus camelliae]